MARFVARVTVTVKGDGKGKKPAVREFIRQALVRAVDEKTVELDVTRTSVPTVDME